MYQPAPDFLMLASYYCRGLSSFPELRRPPLATRPPPQPDSSGLSKKSVGWAAGPERNCHKESCHIYFWGLPTTCLAICPSPRMAPGCLLSPCPALAAVGQSWPAFLAGCWMALGERRGPTFGSCCGCAA